MSTAPRFIPHYTLEDYQHWEGDWELIDGVPISMSPSPFGPHQRIISQLSFQIQSQLEGKSCNCHVYTNLDWIISDDTVLRPDLMVVCGDQPERHLERAPELMVEVLSDSTRSRDLTAKRALAHENGVQHYLIIDPVDQSTNHITAQGQRSHGLEDVIPLQSAACHCDVQIDCRRLFA